MSAFLAPIVRIRFSSDEACFCKVWGHSGTAHTEINRERLGTVAFS